MRTPLVALCVVVFWAGELSGQAVDPPAILPASNPSTAPAKPPVPSPEARNTALRAMKERLKAEYVNPRAKAELISKLAALESSPAISPAERFVVLDEIRRIAGELGDSSLAFRTLEVLESSYKGDLADVRAHTLSELAKSARTADAARDLLPQILTWIDVSIYAENWDDAKRLFEDARLLAAKAPDPAITASLTELGKTIPPAWEAHTRLASTRKRLEQNPGDPAANLAMGQHFCFFRGRWELGLPYLARGSDAELKAMAMADLANPLDAASQAALGDKWYALAQKRLPQKNQILARAGQWYAQCVDRLAGVQKEVVSRRISELGDLIRELPGAGGPGSLAVPWNEGLIRIVAPPDRITTMAVFADGRRLVLATRDGLQVYDMQSERFTDPFKLDAGRRVQAMFFTRDGRWLVVASQSNITSYGVENAGKIGSWDVPPKHQMTSCALAGNNLVMAMLSDTTGQAVANVTRGTVAQLDATGQGKHHQLFFSANGLRLISLDSERDKHWVRILSCETGRVLAKADLPAGGASLLQTPDPKVFMLHTTVQREPVISVRSLDNGAETLAAKIALSRATPEAAISGDLVLLRHEENLVVWSLKQGRAVQTMPGGTSDTRQVIVTADGRFAVTLHGDEKIRIWGLKK